MGSIDERILMERSDTEEDEAFLFGMQLVSFSVLPMVLKAAIELDVLEIIAKSGPNAHISAAQIASQMHTNNPNASLMLDRMLRLLASYKVLTCSLRGVSERSYGLTPVCKFLTKNPQNVSLAPLCLMNQDKVLMESWYHLKDAVLEGGIPFNKAYGMSAFEYQGKDARFNKVFNKAMSDHSTLAMNKILESYQGFEDLRSIVDVGGGIGSTVNMIVSRYPGIKGINFDLPHVIQNAPTYTGVEHVGGDMFVTIPKADAIFMKWICHDWSDDQCLKLLRNCYKALPMHGKVIVAECILPESPNANLATKEVVHVDVIMLAHNPGGKERTRGEFERLAKVAGFGTFRLTCCSYNTWLMEFRK